MIRLPKETPNPARDQIRAKVAAQAEADHTMFPQYKGHWDGPEWMPCKIRRDIKTKLGLAFAAGEITIGHLHGRIETGPYAGQISVTCYSVRNKCNTGLRENSVEWL